MNGRAIDLAVLGGGLAGGLIALACATLAPHRRVVVIEAGPRAGGNHIWSFFDADVSPLDRWLIEPLIVHRWSGYDVRFPAHARQLSASYNSITGERLDAVLRERLPARDLWCNAEVVEAGPTHALLADGRRIEAGAVIDVRGATGLPHMVGGWQKFAGQTLHLDKPHGLARPIVMDATVEQLDGYRFVYCLPFSETEVFVEDTYYSTSPALDVPLLHDRIAAYAAAQGWTVTGTSRSETGVLPVIASGDFAAFWRAGDSGLARAGTRAALVHPLTGYSLPDAVRLAMDLARLDTFSGAALALASRNWAEAHWRQGSFYRMLTKMLFAAARPEERYRVLQRFYRLPEPLIERFYSGRSTLADRMRVLAGKPPVPLLAALRSLVSNDGLAPLEVA